MSSGHDMLAKIMASGIIGIPKVKGPDDLESKFDVLVIRSAQITVPAAALGQTTKNSLVIGTYPANSSYLMVMRAGQEVLTGKTVTFYPTNQMSGQYYYYYGSTVEFKDGVVTFSGYITYNRNDDGKTTWGPMTYTSPEVYVMAFV